MDERQQRLLEALISRGMDPRRADLAVRGLPDPDMKAKADRVRRAFADSPHLALGDGDEWLVLCRRCGDVLPTGRRGSRSVAIQAALDHGWKVSLNDEGGTAVCPVCRRGAE